MASLVARLSGRYAAAARLVIGATAVMMGAGFLGGHLALNRGMALTAQPQGRHLTAPPGWNCPIGLAAAMCVGLTMPPTLSTLPEPGERDEVQAWLLNRQFTARRPWPTTGVPRFRSRSLLNRQGGPRRGAASSPCPSG